MNKQIIKTDEQGFVLITALMVIFLIVTIVTTVALITTQDMRASARARAIVTTRITAESVADAVYATIAKEKNGYAVAAIAKFVDNSTSVQPLASSAGPTPDYGGWFIMRPNGSLEPCDSAAIKRETCFKAKIVPDTAPGLLREIVTLTIIARGGCIVDSAGNESHCVYRRFEQQFSTRSFIDTVQLTNFELPSPLLPGYSSLPRNPLLPPASPYEPTPVAFLRNDAVVGEVFTNDVRGYYYCGAVDLASGDFKTADTGALSRIDVGECTVGPTWLFVLPYEGRQFIPSQVNNAGENTDVTTASNVFRDLAGGTTASTYNYPAAGSNVTIQLGQPAYGRMNVRSGSGPFVEVPYPSNGVIFVNGNISISGNYSRSLSVVATGNITITDNILFARNPATTFDGTVGTLDSNEAMMGILAGENIVVECAVGSRCPDRQIVASLSAPNGTIFNNAWNDSRNLTPNSPPVLTIFGTIVAQYRPVFGSYFAEDDDPAIAPGSIQHGWAKTLRYDDRLKEFQPPYFFRTTQAAVARTALETSSCNEAICSL